MLKLLTLVVPFLTFFGMLKPKGNALIINGSYIHPSSTPIGQYAKVGE